MGRLEGKVSLVTGAGSGIGRAIAILFAQEGSNVIANDRRGDAVEETAAMIRQKGGMVSVQEGDVSVSKDVDAIVDAAIRNHGRVDVLVNVAGGSLGVNEPAATTTEAQFDAVIANNVKSTFLMSKAVIPHMIRSGGGAVINMGSIFGLSGVPSMAAYCAAKAAVVNLSRQMAADYGARHIRVNCLCPGPIRTPALEKLLTGRFDRMAAATLVGRMGQPEDVAHAALYLASDEASFVTGTALVIDGGYDARLFK
ncbi:MAG: SDR family oxidoreductase [Chloroflexi bacterium]|nr:SDR family oxidoreductase [Chloroflexota bacterium]